MFFRKRSRRIFIATLALGVSVCLAHVSTTALGKDGDEKQAQEVVLTFQRSGGIAGFNDDVTIYSDSNYAIKIPLRGKPPRTGKLSDEQQATLGKLLATFGKVDWSQSDPPNVSDGMSVAITIRGSGKKTTLTPADAEFRQIHNFVATVLRPLGE